MEKGYTDKPDLKGWKTCENAKYERFLHYKHLYLTKARLI